MTDATTCVFLTLDNAANAPVDNNSFWPRRQLRPLPSMTDATTSNLAKSTEEKQKVCLQHPVFPGGHPSKY
ncbi:hypothetical protein C0Q70_07281 [Pomacea canaliculata]|uniref:Uncharacterized protein n=1 Tax=Pomacea canaliculata TaxID=400727 RepID=A0A2T7PEM3_POMCA|nr:hypothetical protein C0Q70_07281 [Pomacea canaliculata]